MDVGVAYLLVGLCLLLAVFLSVTIRHYPVSAPMALVGIGMLVGLTPLVDGIDVDPVAHRVAIEHITEITVLVALMGVGLALDRPLSPRDRMSWRRWSPTWRLLFVAMPLCIGATALLGWGLLGLAPATALLVGAVLAPTDPVLASEVQVEGPQVGAEEEIDERDEVRFALTSEAGLNDGLAFPFVTGALLLAGAGSLGPWVGRWLAWDVVLKVVIGVVVGAVVGRMLAMVAFRSPRASLRVAERGDPLLALAALLTAYGLSEVVHGYGFLAVFTCALTVRAADRAHGYHEAMHGVVERLERLLTLLVLLALGVATTRGLLADLDLRGVATAVALVLVIRPLAGYLSLRLRHREPEAPGGLTRREAVATGFFGVRGVGSIYYLAYAGGHTGLADERWLWSTVGFTIVLSVVVHGVTATPAMRWLEERRESTG